MTKEAKLSAAQRIVPEWKDYDTEIKTLMARIDDEQHQEQSTGKQKKGINLNRFLFFMIYLSKFDFIYYLQKMLKKTRIQNFKSIWNLFHILYSTFCYLFSFLLKTL